jgi:phosphonoacetate hydrolase
VTCPITDYFVAHHGSLGSFVRVYCHRRATPQAVMRLARKIPGAEAVVYDGTTAARMFDLPINREGEIVVISDGGTCIGTIPSTHLSALGGRALRTHGGIAESHVPFILNYSLNDTYAERAARGGLRNFHIFDFAINRVVI